MSFDTPSLTQEQCAGGLETVNAAKAQLLRIKQETRLRFENGTIGLFEYETIIHYVDDRLEELEKVYENLRLLMRACITTAVCNDKNFLHSSEKL
jgi:hypothetical protein